MNAWTGREPRLMTTQNGHTADESNNTENTMNETDPTESIRRALVPLMPDAAAAAQDAGEQTWTTDQLMQDFDVQGFMAPFVVVKRKSDGVKGTLEFAHSPRVYFGWNPS